MRAYEISPQFGFENLHVTRRPRPRPGPGQILLRMEAVSLNYRDLLVIRGHYNPRWKLPLVPCTDGVGVVEKRGRRARRFEVGQRLCPIFAQRWLAGPPTPARRGSTLGGPGDGTLTQYMVIDEESGVAAPDHLSAAEAACFPCAGVTAWNALITQGRLRAGQTVLIQGSGGVALFALIFARTAGARVIALTSTNAKRRRLERMGAEHTINYRETPEWGKVVRSMTGGVDHVIEVGGARTINESLAAVRMDGRVAMIGNLSGASARINLIPILMGNIRIQGVFVGSGEIFEEMNAAVRAHKLKPVIDRRFGFDDASKAFQRLASGKHFGKVVIEF